MNIHLVTQAMQNNVQAAVIDALCGKLEALLRAVYDKPVPAETLKLVAEANDQLTKAKRLGNAKALQMQPIQVDFCEWGQEMREDRISKWLAFLRQ